VRDEASTGEDDARPVVLGLRQRWWEEGDGWVQRARRQGTLLQDAGHVQRVGGCPRQHLGHHSFRLLLPPLHPRVEFVFLLVSFCISSEFIFLFSLLVFLLVLISLCFSFRHT
jgi:hypothetical protein